MACGVPCVPCVPCCVCVRACACVGVGVRVCVRVRVRVMTSMQLSAHGATSVGKECGGGGYQGRKDELLIDVDVVKQRALPRLPLVERKDLGRLLILRKHTPRARARVHI